jgi:hypothetical protein
MRSHVSPRFGNEIRLLLWAGDNTTGDLFSLSPLARIGGRGNLSGLVGAGPVLKYLHRDSDRGGRYKILGGQSSRID